MFLKIWWSKSSACWVEFKFLLPFNALDSLDFDKTFHEIFLLLQSMHSLDLSLLPCFSNSKFLLSLDFLELYPHEIFDKLFEMNLHSLNLDLFLFSFLQCFLFFEFLIFNTCLFCNQFSFFFFFDSGISLFFSFLRTKKLISSQFSGLFEFKLMFSRNSIGFGFHNGLLFGPLVIIRFFENHNFDTFLGEFTSATAHEVVSVKGVLSNEIPEMVIT